jgi:alkyl sulfatase BDS1-like metallo-beta-lactamase superfamily hydrolase
MSTELFLDFMGIRLDSNKAEGKEFKINIALPDVKEQFILELSNATLTNIQGYQAKDADLTITIKRTDLELMMSAQKSFDQLVAEGKAKLSGNAKVVEQLAQMLDVFTPTFEMLPGTKAKTATLPAVPNKLAQPSVELRGE